MAGATGVSGHESAAARRFVLRGMGWRENQRLRRTVQILAEADRDRSSHSAVFVEDTVLILLDYLEGEGYLDPRVLVTAIRPDRSVVAHEWAMPFASRLSRHERFRKVRFKLIPGRRFYYDALGIAGLDSPEMTLTADDVNSYFFPDAFLYRPRHGRVFTPERFQRSMNNLQEVLRRQGFRDAKVTGNVMTRDLETGGVRAVVNMESGPRYLVRHLTTQYSNGHPGWVGAASPVEIIMQPWSRLWEQDTLLRIRNAHYAEGYAEMQCAFSVERIEASEAVRFADLIATVQAGPRLHTGDIRFKGQAHTKTSAMRRRLSLQPGDPLDPLAAEHTRQRLAAMGSFERVSLEYMPSRDLVRDMIYTVQEGKRLEVSLLAGYGSYELLRGGLEVEQFNLWGRGHRSRLLLVQSFKSTEADYLYSIPELLGERISGFSRVSALRRDEIDFLRRETGVEAGVRRYSPRWKTDTSLRYSYTLLESREFEVIQQVGLPEAQVGAVSSDIRWDRRDNPVSPARGAQVFTRAELAARIFGGEAEYLVWEVGGSFHRRIGGGRKWHAGIQHGVVNALGAEVDKLPFNKRFFPGGDRSLRGYRHGEAASLNADGQLIGSEFYGLLQNEIEQALTPALGLVAFVDILQSGSALDDYPHGDLLISTGVGLRYQTIVGPLRAEYGHNLRRRGADPHGTLHLSVGFPF